MEKWISILLRHFFLFSTTLFYVWGMFSRSQSYVCVLLHPTNFIYFYVQQYPILYLCRLLQHQLYTFLCLVAPNLISATPTSSNHPIKPSTVSSDIEDSAPRVTSRVVGSHRSPTIPNVSLPIPPTSLAVGSNRPLSPGHRVSPSPSVEKFQPPSSFGLNFTLGSWSPLGNMTSNGHHDNGGNGTGGGSLSLMLMEM